MQRISPLKKPKTLKEMAYTRIRDLFSSGQLTSSDIISANQYAEDLQVSRTPVREALLQLASEGFLVAVDGRGFKIKDFSAKEIHDLFEARRIIETYIVRQLVGSLSEADFAFLHRSLESMKELLEYGDPSQFLKPDEEFHLSLVRRHDNLFLESITEHIHTLVSILGPKSIAREKGRQAVIKEHSKILEALRQNDGPKAAEAMSFHLDASEKRILGG
ncbi:MAG: hypothetical protein B1H12_01080 [Desulfobacteraceae bacterium 4484_190.2]|nr:MAG: hypothetical protein B1H12_01080 [Desulfobacteraceae bacterium 4484_190.2]